MKSVSKPQESIEYSFAFFLSAATDGNEEKRSNKKSADPCSSPYTHSFASSRCQLLSCTTEKLGKKKNRKNRLRAFPTKWNELTKENREVIRRSLSKIFLFSSPELQQLISFPRNSSQRSAVLYSLLRETDYSSSPKTNDEPGRG